MARRMKIRAARTFSLAIAAAVLAVVGVGLRSPSLASATRGVRTGHISASQTDPVTARYDKAMKRVGDGFAKGMGEIYPLLSGTQGSTVRAATIQHLQRGSSTLAGVVADLKRVRPPARVRKLHERLTAEVADLRMEMVGMIQSLQSNDLVRFMTLSGLAALAPVNNTINLIQYAGYRFLGQRTATAPCGDC